MGSVSQYTPTRAIVCDPPTADGKRQWSIKEIQVQDVGEDELLVELVSSGVCHTDLICGTAPEGAPGFPLPPYPRILGHEGAGYVRKVGSKVTTAKTGDAVLLSFDYCTRCKSCEAEAPGYCNSFMPLNFSGKPTAFFASEKDVAGCFFGQSSFANFSVVKDNSIVNVQDVVKDRTELQKFAPLGCGFQTGAGTITKLAGCGPKDVVAVMGLGGVGLAAIMSAKISGAKQIIGIDRVESRLQLAGEVGATHTINTTGLESLVSEVQKLSGGDGASIVVDTTGVPALIQHGTDFTANRGKMVLLGVAPGDAVQAIPIVPFMVSGKQLLGSMEGGVRPCNYVPEMIKWNREGKFPIEKLIKYFPAEEYEKAIEEMETGETVKPVLLWS